MNVLVTGGAGYIGSHVVKELLISGNDVLVLDNFSTGHREALDVLQSLPEITEGRNKLKVISGDTGDRTLLISLLSEQSISAIIHLAAFSQVGESMQNPGKYFDNNVARAINILECMALTGVKHIVFSSSAAVYGEPSEIPIREKHSAIPTNVYGASKQMVEDLLKWYDRIYGIKYISLRYFNAAGADASGLIGEHHEPETHLIPIVMQRILGQRDELFIYGNDYPTDDGTCVRDYVHVTDLAQAHKLALTALTDGSDSHTYNLGNGNGYSVKEVIDTVADVVGITIPYTIGKRRPGDPAILVASADKIKSELGWKPDYPSLQDIVSTAWEWHKRYPSGYNLKCEK
jgi:UDP-glucose 4-epimerase